MRLKVNNANKANSGHVTQTYPVADSTGGVTMGAGGTVSTTGPDGGGHVGHSQIRGAAVGHGGQARVGGADVGSVVLPGVGSGRSGGVAAAVWVAVSVGGRVGGSPGPRQGCGVVVGVRVPTGDSVAVRVAV